MKGVYKWGNLSLKMILLTPWDIELLLIRIEFAFSLIVLVLLLLLPSYGLNSKVEWL